MVLEYLTTKRYEYPEKYVRETMLIFTDPQLELVDYTEIEKMLSEYKGESGEVIEIKIVKNKSGPGALINLVIICFKRLLELLNVTEKGYSRFIEKHKQDFMAFYSKVIQ